MADPGYYEHYWSEHGFRPRFGIPPQTQDLLERHLSSADRCLDFGCGDGHGAGRWLAQRVGEYVGVDISSTAVEEARRLGLEARAVEPGRPLPFGDSSFDAVVSLEVLEHLAEPGPAVAELARVLRPGGALIVSVPNIGFWRRRLELLIGRWNPAGDPESTERSWRDPHLRFFTRASLGRMLAEAGLVEVRISGHGGGLVRMLPGIRRFVAGRSASGVYASLERRFPGLLASRLAAVAVKSP